MSDELPADVGGSLAAVAGLAAGSRVAGYLLEEQVGAGGMAVVYRALDERLDRRVALKVLAPALAADQAFRQRFIRESRAAAAVDDPHIIPVFEAGEASGVLFIAMRYVPGGDVRSLVRRDGPLSPRRAMEIISQVASALDAAHRRGLVHRDVKPANMLMDASSDADRPDHVYLSDFGLSKGAPSSVGLTSSGQFLGTPAYMAPEQIEGRQVDGRTDEYALACAVFEMLSGSPPFPHHQPMALIWAQMSESPPPLTSRRPDLPPAVDAVLARAMAKAPQDRYASCRMFTNALRGALELVPYDSGPGAVQPLEHPPTEFTWPAADGAPGDRVPAAVATVRPGQDPGRGAAAGTAGNPIGPANAPGSSPSAADGARTASRQRRRGITPVTFAGISVLVAAGIVAAAILLHSPSAGTAGTPSAVGTSTPSTGPTSTPTTGVTSTPSTGPTSTPGTNSRSAPITSTPSYILQSTLPEPGVNAVAFSSDGKILATGSPDGTYLWDPGTGNLTATLPDPGSGGVYAVAFGPDHILAAGDHNGSTYLWNASTQKLIATLRNPGNVYAVAFSPDGTTLAVGDFNHHTYLWDVATRKRIAALTDPASLGVNAVAFNPDGNTLATGDYNGSTYLWDVATRAMIAALPVPGAGDVLAVAFSPDGKTLATGDFDGSTYLWNVANASQVGTASPAGTLPDPGVGTAVEALAFSPDGSTLAAGDVDGSTYLWNLANPSVATPLALPGSGRRHVWAVAFSPDGNKLATGNHYGNTYLWQAG